MKISIMIKLLLPILFPSWRFFSSIGLSPRIEVGFIEDKNSEPQEWLPFRPLPKKVNFTLGLQQLFHNPLWNERLYINTCAEHLFENYSEFREREIGRRLVSTLSKEMVAVLNKKMVVGGEFQYLVFRIRALEFEAGQVRDDVVFVSKAFALLDAGDKQ
ncbi:MAG: hypothetical protein Q7T48_07945 [Cellvibrio sp.]|uniref:hypothetical protein n=1 Tax=Cellvibrio sp. TaxID=1965322 RepID=UPI002725E698|nr:hypothetical protein [Cellvibrio sp.]